MVPGGTFVDLVRFEGHIIDGVGGIDAHAPLDAAADLLAEHAGHILLLVQVVGVLMDVGKTIDSFTSEMRDGSAQVLVLRLGGLIEGSANGIQAVHLALIGAVDQLTVKVDVPPHLGQSLDILFLCPHLIFPSLLNE
jgi:hypothetical protein